MLQKIALWLCLASTTVSAFAGDVLRYSTATTIKVGPLTGTQVIGETGPESFTVDATILLSKNGGKLEEVDASLTLDSHNLYDLPLSAEMTDTYGRLDVVVINGDKVVKESYGIINAAAWDEQHSPLKVGGHLTQVDVREWLGNAVSATISGKPEVDVYALGGQTTALANQENAFDGYTGDFEDMDGTDGKILLSADAQTGVTIPNVTTTATATAIASGGITNATFATDVGTTAYASNRIAQAADKGVTNYDPPTKAELDLLEAHGDGYWIAATGFSTHSAADVWSVGTRTITGTGVGAFTSLSFAAGSITGTAMASGVIGADELTTSAINKIADGVWDEAIAGHTTGTTFGGKNQIGVPSATLNDYKADVSSLATTSQLNARTLVAADYFLFGTDTVANVTATGSVTGNVSGNVTGSVGSISGVTFPGNFGDLAITVTTGKVTATVANADAAWVDGSGRVDVGQFLGTALDADYPANINVFFGVNPTTTKTVNDVGTAAGTMDANLIQIEGHALAGTGTYIADRFEAFFNQATSQYNVNTPLSSFKADVSNLDTTVSSRATPAQVATALTDINLDHLAGTATGIPAIPAGTWIDTIIDDTNELQTDDVPGLIAALNNISTAQVNTQVDTALSDINLDHLVFTATAIPAVTAGTYLDQIMDDGTAVYDRTTDSLQAIRDVAPHGTAMRGTESAYTGTPPTVVQIRTEMDSNSVDLNDILTDTGTTLNTHLTDIKGATWNSATDALDAIRAQGDVAWLTGSGTSTLTTAQVDAEVDEAIENYHLDHLFANNYDPAAKPGSATALLNELVENDGGVSRYTSNALEQAPGGGSSADLLLSTTVNVVDSQTQVTLNAGSDQDDAYNGAIVILTDASNSSYPSIRTVTDYVGTTKTLVIDAAPGFTSDMISGDGVNIFIAERTLDQAAAIDGKTLRQAIRYLGAAIAGETSGAGTGTEVFKGLDGLTDRVQVIIDSNGDRTTINYDP